MDSEDRQQRCILIVDDTPQNLQLLGELLQPRYQIRVANSGERALQLIADQPLPDLILLDVIMPGLSGYDVLRRLQAEPRTASIPVIFITAMDGSACEEQGLSLGAVDYITKPINPAVVLARVQTQMELKTARDRLAHQNDWLEAEVDRRLRENRMVQDLSIRALASLAEARDNETGRHILRTQAYVELLAWALADHERFRDQLTPERISRITKAAPLHDIGKIGIPDAILRKQGRLTADEMAIMRTHPAIGANAIRDAMAASLAEAGPAEQKLARDAFAFLEVAAEIAGGHHEKWDGSGYPAGLAGEAIPVSARLMALADVFEALLSKRVYKEPIGLTEATQMILGGRGTHFDPAVVDAFVSQRERFAEIAASLADPEPAAAERETSTAVG